MSKPIRRETPGPHKLLFRWRMGRGGWSLLAAIVLAVVSVAGGSGSVAQGAAPSVILSVQLGTVTVTHTTTASIACLDDVTLGSSAPFGLGAVPWNDLPSAIHVDAGLTVTLYEHCRGKSNFPGASLVLGAGDHDLTTKTAATSEGPKPWSTIVSALDIAAAGGGSTPTPNPTPTGTPGPSPVISKTVPSLPPFSPSSWMTDLGDEIKDKTLLTIKLPGSHDSATAHSYSTGVMGESADTAVQLAGVGMASPWAEAQDRTISEQLNLGIRYLDLRVEKSAKAAAPGYRIVHSVLFGEVGSVLQEVADFISAHPKEIIILDFQAIEEFNGAADHTAFKQLVLAKIPNARIVEHDRNNQSQDMTIGDMWAKNQQVIIYYTSLLDHPDATLDKYFWQRGSFQGNVDYFDFLASEYTDTCDMLDLGCLFRTRQGFFDKYAQDHTGNVADSVYIFQGQLTPSGNYPVEAIAGATCSVVEWVFTFGQGADCPEYAYSLRDAAVNSNQPFLYYLLRNWLGEHFNVVILDFFHKMNADDPGSAFFAQSLVELNRTSPSAEASVAPSGSTPGVTATLTNNTAGSAPATVDVFTYPSNPTGTAMFDVGGGFLDLRVTGADLGDRVQATFYYPPTVTGDAETNLLLLFHDGAAWRPVVSSIFPFKLPTKNTADNQNGTTSGGSFAATFDAYSIPPVTALTGTVFTYTADSTPPAAVHNGPFAITEGQIVTLDGSASSDNIGVASIAWDIDGDGFDDENPVAYKGLDGPATVPVSLRVVDGAGNQTVVAAQVTVTNAAPAVTAGDDLQANEGATVSLVKAMFLDPGVKDTHTATINWGDGTGIQPGTVSGADGFGTIAGSHVYGDNGIYTAAVCVTDDDGAQTCDTLIVTVSNVKPAVNAGADITADEGSMITLAAAYTDPGFDNLAGNTRENFTATVNWGDGTVEPLADLTVTETPGSGLTPTAGTVRAMHAYGDNGSYTVTVCVTDDDSAVTCDTLAVTVKNVKPSVNAGTDVVTDEGAFITLAATYSDPGFDSPPSGTQENFTATVNWGDGNIEPLADITVTETSGTEQAPTTGTVRAMHAYGDNGAYTVTVCVTDDDSAVTCDTLSVTVKNVKPSVNAGPDVTINESGTVTLAPAAYSDPGFDNPPGSTQENFTATIDWGEGTVVAGVLTESPGAEGSLTTGTVSGSHVYSDDGPYTVTVCVTDDDQATTCDTLVVTVNNVAPVLDDNSFLDDGIVFTSNERGFLGRKGVPQTHDAKAADQGSDDLRFTWTYKGAPDEFSGGYLPLNPLDYETYFNSGAPSGALPFADPPTDNETRPHPHGVFPFTAMDTSRVTFTAPGMYRVSLSVTDDNGGADAISLPKVVVDTLTCSRSQGFWGSELQKAAEGKAKGRKFDDNTLRAYLDIVNFTSSVFSESTPAATLVKAALVMGPGGAEAGDPDPDNMKGKAIKQALAAWMNFAAGSVAWGAVTPSGQPFSSDIAQVEALIRNPNSAHADYVRAKSIAEAINLMGRQCTD